MIPYVWIDGGGSMGIDPSERRLILAVAVFVVVCVVIGGVWPWLIR